MPNELEKKSDILNPQDEEALRLITDVLQKAARNLNYELHEVASTEDELARFNQRAQEVMQPWVSDPEKIRVEDTKIYLAPDIVNDDCLGVLCFLPMIFEGMNKEGTYELIVDGEPFAEVTYKGEPDQDPDSMIIKAGIPVDIKLYQKVKRVVIDLVVQPSENSIKEI